jgi:DNA repair protein RecN (Recombination protein N)
VTEGRPFREEVAVLVSLTIRDFVLIDELTIELAEGLHVISGETGAGKSILIDALALVLGGRASPEVVRTGCEQAEVEALFDVDKAPELRARLVEAELLAKGSDEDELVIRRVVGANGRSKAYVNGRLVTAAQLAQLARGLVDVSSQHESQTLCDPSTHGAMLDAYARLEPLREEVAQKVSAALAVAKRAAEVRAKVETARAREDFLRFQLHEIDELSITPGEEKELEATRGRLRHADRLASATRAAVDRLDEGENSLLDGLRRVASEISFAASLDDTLAADVASIEGAIEVLQDAARTLGRYAEEVEADPDRLAEIEERLFKIQRLVRKHGGTTEDLLARRDELARELATLDSADATLDELDKERRALLEAATKAAKKLSKKRSDAATSLGEAIAVELSSLAMGRARITVDVAPIAAPSQASASGAVSGAEDDGLVVSLEGGEKARLTRSGLDRVEIMIAPNPGEEPKPLRKIASGGELSRALLAVKRVLASNAPAGLYVFDEVDAGVGGAVAEAIGRKIADVAKHHQVLCITHLAQIAAFADVHFAVSKREEAGRTIAEVKKLKAKERGDEIARMLGGATITPTTRKAAEEMLRASQKGREKGAKG